MGAAAKNIKLAGSTPTKTESQYNDSLRGLTNKKSPSNQEYDLYKKIKGIAETKSGQAQPAPTTQSPGAGRSGISMGPGTASRTF